MFNCCLESASARYGHLSIEMLQEVFSYYMQCRYGLLQIIKKQGMEKEVAIALLANYCPRIHEYFETDLKNAFQARLEYYCLEMDMRGLKSQCLSKHASRENNRCFY